MTLALATLAATLAVYRLAFMVTREDGPLDVFTTLRSAASRLPDKVEGNRRQPHWVARGISCPLCVSWWLSLVAAMIVIQAINVHSFHALWLWPAIAGGCLFLYQIGGT